MGICNNVDELQKALGWVKALLHKRHISPSEWSSRKDIYSGKKSEQYLSGEGSGGEDWCTQKGALENTQLW